jgi:hypothetical protein
LVCHEIGKISILRCCIVARKPSNPKWETGWAVSVLADQSGDGLQ